MHLVAAGSKDEAQDALLASPEGAAAASVTNKQQQTPLHLAAAYGKIGLVKRLLELHPKAISIVDKQGLTPLQLAVANGHQVCCLLPVCKRNGLSVSNTHAVLGVSGSVHW